jgi:6-phosphogluconate dehydrogenase
MQIGVIGLGRMGSNIARRLMRGGHSVVAFDQNGGATATVGAEGATPATSLEDMASKFSGPRVFWIMLPAGAPMESTVDRLMALGMPGDIIIDGGNTFYKDDIRRARSCRGKEIHYVDVGTSGGVWGLERGFCLMIGGPADTVDFLDPVFDTLAPGYGNIARTPGREPHDPRAERGYIHAGPAGAGHFVKMVHNGIEYVLMAAYAEGFNILKNKCSDRLPEEERFDINLPDVAEV